MTMNERYQRIRLTYGWFDENNQQQEITHITQIDTQTDDVVGFFSRVCWGVIQDLRDKGWIRCDIPPLRLGHYLFATNKEVIEIWLESSKDGLYFQEI